MKDENDFSRVKRGLVLPLPSHQTEVRLRLDNEVLDWLRKSVSKSGEGSYADNINSILQAQIDAQADAVFIQAMK